MDKSWKCFARPATKGSECGYVNERGGITYYGRECCSDCGSTRIASNARSTKINAKIAKNTQINPSILVEKSDMT